MTIVQVVLCACMYVCMYAGSTVATLSGWTEEWTVKRVKDKLKAQKNYWMDVSIDGHRDGYINK